MSLCSLVSRAPGTRSPLLAAGSYGIRDLTAPTDLAGQLPAPLNFWAGLAHHQAIAHDVFRVLQEPLEDVRAVEVDFEADILWPILITKGTCPLRDEARAHSALEPQLAQRSSENEVSGRLAQF